VATHCNTRHHTASHHVTLQHAATQCNTLRLRTSTPAPGASERSAAAHTATLCNTLHHMASHGITLQHTITHCNTLHHTAPENIHIGTRSIRKKRANTTHHTATHRNTLQHTITHCNTQHLRTSTPAPGASQRSAATRGAISAPGLSAEEKTSAATIHQKNSSFDMVNLAVT